MGILAEVFSGGVLVLRNPASAVEAFAAESVKVEWIYTRAICEDSTSESSTLSWIMHGESIHRYWNPRRRATRTASRKFGHRQVRGIQALCEVNVDSSVLLT